MAKVKLYDDEKLQLECMYAGLAMLGFLVSPITANTASDSPSSCAEWAWQQADAMMKHLEVKDEKS